MLESIARTLPVVLVAWPMAATVVAIALAGREVHRRRWVLGAMTAETAMAAAALVTAVSVGPVESADDWVRLRLGLDWAFRPDVPRTLLLLLTVLGVTALTRRVGRSARPWAMLPALGGLSAVLLGVDAGMQALAGVGIVAACEIARRFPVRRRWRALRCVGAMAVLVGVSAMAGIHYRRTGYLSFLSADLAWMHYGPAHAWLTAILAGGLVLRLGGAVLPFMSDSTSGPTDATSPDLQSSQPPGPMPQGPQRSDWLMLAGTVELAVTLGLGLSVLKQMLTGPWDAFSAATGALPAQTSRIPFPLVGFLVLGGSEAWRLARGQAKRPVPEFMVAWSPLLFLGAGNAGDVPDIPRTQGLICLSAILSAVLAMGSIWMARDDTHADRGAAICVAIAWLTLAGTPPLGAWPVGVLPAWHVGVYWVDASLWWVAALGAIAWTAGLLMSFALGQVGRIVSGKPRTSLDGDEFRTPPGLSERLVLAGMIAVTVTLGVWPAMGL